MSISPTDHRKCVSNILNANLFCIRIYRIKMFSRICSNIISHKITPFLLLFNSLDKLQTKPVNFISHICAFSRGVLNVRSTRSHPTLAPRPQIWLMKFAGFCAVAGEDELNRGEGIWGQKLMSSALSPKSPQPLFV